MKGGGFNPPSFFHQYPFSSFLFTFNPQYHQKKIFFKIQFFL
jgi:hypothetical protein